MGLVALFDLSELAPGIDPDRARFRLVEPDDSIELYRSRLGEDLSRLVEIGVNEVFFAVLRLLAQSQITVLDPALGAAIYARLRNAQPLAKETASYVLATDRCLVSTAGQGMLTGWYLPAAATAEPLVALAFADGMVAPVDLQMNSTARADLAAYGDRYTFTGRDGYVGAWRFSQAPTGSTQLMFLIPGEPSASGVIVNTEPASAATLAGQIVMSMLALEDTARRVRLRRGTLPAYLDIGAFEPVAAAPAQGETLVVLDHDLIDTDLRDVLRRIARLHPNGFALHLLRQSLTPIMQSAITAIGHEYDGAVRLVDVDLALATPREMPGRVVFARSSSIFQFDIAPLFAADAAGGIVLLHDPIGSVLGSRPDDAARFARDGLPFAVMMEGAAFFAQRDAIPHVFLTEESRIRLLTEMLMELGMLDVQRVDVYRYFMGKSGPFTQALIDGRDWHEYDAESRKLLTESLPS
ncbi:hypothetical protein [Ketogulonicigenium vulgare]|uniref:hypothetical protein n=1 Tax=Ketogulonicigenium vulgare TaxID=92945 RepID=UPI0011DF2D83|nr:hypothetical protein [Ketogulonicigenium vulgare]